jgi:hypothetical protein
MADRTPIQEQAIIDFEVRLSRTAMRQKRSGEALNRSDDRIRVSRHRRVMHDAARVKPVKVPDV